MAALRSVFGLVLIILSSAAADELCAMCDCTRSASQVGQMQSIICQKPNRKLFEDDVEWPKNVQRIELIEFRDILSAVLPIFKCDKEIGEIRFERSNLKGVDRKALMELPKVEKFSFATNTIEKLSPDTFAYNSMVTAMNFSGNKLETLPPGLFAKLDDLLVIDLSFNQVQILSAELIETIKSLSVVDLRKNSLYAIDQVDTHNVLIEALDLSDNKLRFLKSKQFKSFNKLKQLNLKNNQLKDIQDDAFMELDSLLSLDLSNNQLASIKLILPGSLTHFHIRNNLLDVWPIKEINPALSLVDLHNNTLDAIHIRGHESIHIEHLIVSGNNLEGLPKKNFPKLKSLDLSFNKFETVPEELGRIAPALDSLIMTGNPIEIVQFTAPLTISRLVFKKMPLLTTIYDKSFENVTGRSSSSEFEPFLDLSISHCPQLSVIEGGAFDGISFNDLDLSHNKIAKFSQSLTNWTSVTGHINLQGNPLTCDCVDEWMIAEVLNKLYEDDKLQHLLKNLRCASPPPREGVRLVHFYRHVSPFCGTVKPMRNRLAKEESAQLSGFFSLGNVFGSNRLGPSAWLVIAVCAFTITCLVVVGVVLQRDINRRVRDSQQRMLFSDL